jgi:hypothetical protein
MSVRMEFLRCVSVILHGTIGSYLYDALQGGCAHPVASYPTLMASFMLFFFPFFVGAFSLLNFFSLNS